LLLECLDINKPESFSPGHLCCSVCMKACSCIECSLIQWHKNCLWVDETLFVSWHIQQLVLNTISRIILVYYCKCCNLIGYSTHYLFLDR
jgi:hypothetical protein